MSSYMYSMHSTVVCMYVSHVYCMYICMCVCTTCSTHTCSRTKNICNANQIPDRNGNYIII